MSKFGNRRRGSEETPESTESTAIPMPPVEFHVEPEDDDDDSDDFIDESVPEEDMSPDEAARASERERLAAADALRQWMDEEGPYIRNQGIVRRLHDDIRRNRKMNEWGSFPLDDLLRPPVRDYTALSKAKWASSVTAIRNLLLFLPVLVTWIAIDRAASAYEKSENADSTFLQVWGELEYFSLQRVAFYDAVIIGILILLTAVSHWLDGRAEEQARTLDEASDTRFRAMMVDVGLYLHGFRQITPSALKGGLADAVNQLKAATDEMKDAAVGMNVVADKAASTLEAFASMSAREFTPAAERLAVLVGSLESAASAHADMGELVKVFQAQLSGTIGSLEGNLKAMTGDIVDKLNDNARSLEVALVQAGSKIDEIGNNLQGVAATTGAVVEAMALRRADLRDR